MLNSYSSILENDHYSTSEALFTYYGIDRFKNMQLSEKIFSFDVSNLCMLEIEKEIRNAFKKYGWFGFGDTLSCESLRDPSYGGLGLTYNKNFWKKLEPMSQVFSVERRNLPSWIFKDKKGKKINKKLLDRSLDKVFFNEIVPRGIKSIINFFIEEKILTIEEAEKHFTRIEKDNADESNKQSLILRNTYTDSYGFNSFTKMALERNINLFLRRIKVPIVRSRVCEMIGSKIIAGSQDLFWHRDESPSVEMRLVLSITNPHEKYSIKIRNKGKTFCESFIPGKLYFWDTSLPHCPYVGDNNENLGRLNIVLGLAPWFKFDGKKWTPNEYAGKLSPEKMLLEGKIIDGIEVSDIMSLS